MATMIRAITRKPLKALAAKYDGTITSGNYLMGWVKKHGGRVELYPEGEDGRLVLKTTDGTYDLFESWWLLLDSNKFEVMTPEEFEANYEETT